METQSKEYSRSGKAVVIQMDGASEEDTSLFFLFTVNQVEEVLSEITLVEIPFAPEFIQGMCCWRGQVVPVIDIEKRFGLSGSTHTSSGRYLLVRTGAQDSTGGRQLLRCVFRVPDRIKVIQNVGDSSSIMPEKVGIKSSLVRGTFQQENDIFIVPDVASILEK